MILPLLKVSLVMNIIAVLWIICAVILILVILIQKGRGGGLSSAFGGAMASGILGTKTGDFLTWLTIVLVGIFLFLSVLLAKFYRPTSTHRDVTGGTQQSQPVSPSQPPEVPQSDTTLPVEE